MSRRRIRVVCSSDEEDEEPQPPPRPPPLPQQEQYEEYDVVIDDMETDFQTVTLNSSNPTPSSNYSTTNRCRSRIDQPIPLDISDDDEENVIMSEATDGSNFDIASGNNNCIEVSESPVNGVLERLGLRLKKEWLESCLHWIQSSVAGSQRMDDSAKAKLCFEQFLRSDMNYCGAGVLPRDVHTLNLVDLKGPFVLQVDEMMNISCPLRRRYQNAGAGNSRCLKLSMTDGVQRVFGMEYRPIQDLQALAPAGLKVAVCNVNIRHGLLMLVPEVLQVLGGSVLELEAARQRLVNEINKPSRGKRNRTGAVPPLATRATLAAWPPDNNVVQGQVDRNTSVNTGPQPANTQGNVFGFPGNGRPREGFGVPMRSNAEHSSLPEVQPVERVTISHDINEASTQVETPSRETRQVTPPSIPVDYISVENVGLSVGRHNPEPTGSSALPMDVEEITILDELEHQFMLSRNKDIPFTYLASLSAKCAAMEDEVSVVRGKIKCFLTAVKGFQYKQRPIYELRVFVDDGSLISEILIDHSVVQKGIGYSPQEVTTALESSESEQVSAMKETLKQFQKFLVNFEGTMLVEMNKASPRPVAVEMNQGCSASDACLLLKRLKSFGSRPDDLSHLNPITLSP
ncbi:recQ-mediated genome instability protein 1 [Orobanche gracilis]